MAINIIAAGLTAVLDIAWFNQGGQTPPLLSEVRLLALPYVLTVILLAGFIGSAVAPQALGKPYLKER